MIRTTRPMTRPALFTLLASFAVLCGLTALRLRADDNAKSDDARPAAAAEAGKGRLFEMRTYYASEGKLDALHARFRDHTNKLFQKHGMELVGYWTPADEPGSKNTLIYILAYPDRESREKSWQAFVNDPVWKAAKADSEKDGTPLAAKVESVFLKPTDYSPIK
jgi:hypothetical protein